MESSKQLLHRLATVLPIFESAVEASAIRAKREGESWEFSKRLKSNFTLLIQATENLRPHFGTRHLKSETECRNVLSSISNELNALVPDKAQVKFSKLSYPGLEALRIQENPAALLPYFQEEVYGTWMQKTDGWVSDLAHMLPGRSPKKRPAHSVYDFASTLYRTLEKTFRSKCACSRPHHGLLFMANHHNFWEEKHDTIVFDMLLTGPELMGRRWCDVQVKVPVHEEREIRFQGESVKKTNTSVCSSLELLDRFPLLRSMLLAQRGDFVEDKIKNRKARLGVQVLSSAKVVTLKDLLKSLSNGPKLSFKNLTQLAILLTTSFLHLHGGPWIPDRLDTEMVQFISTTDGLLLIPFLQFTPGHIFLSEHSAERPPSRLDLESSRAARVGLGILLFELFTQTVSQSKLPKDIKAVSMEALFEIIFDVDDTLQEWENEEKFGLILDAINACFNVTGNSLGGEYEECESFYETVIGPLEDQLIRESELDDQNTENINPQDLDSQTFREVLVPITVQNKSSNSESRAWQQWPYYNGDISLTCTTSVIAAESEKLDHIPATISDKNQDETSQNPSLNSSQHQDLVPPRSPEDVPSARAEHLPASALKATSHTINKTLPITREAAQIVARKYDYTKYLDYLAGTTKSQPIKIAANWLKDFVEIDKMVLQRLAVPKVPAKVIKVAILDTGCCLDTGFFDKMWHPGDKERVMGEHWKDFLNEHNEGPIDEDPDLHGTKIATLLLMLLPRVEIFIGRVAKDTSDFGSITAQRAVAAASVPTSHIGIIHAAKWGADIISLSFGYLSKPSCIEDAIDVALSRQGRNKKLIIFAAANNIGKREQERYPATYRNHVISVRGTFENGSFHNDYNPTITEAAAFGTLGFQVPCTHQWNEKSTVDKPLIMSGCSIATPIMAAIAATYLQYASWKLATGKDEVVSKSIEMLFELEGMVKLFSATAGDTGKEIYVDPSQLFDRYKLDGIKREGLWSSSLIGPLQKLFLRTTAKENEIDGNMSDPE